MNIAVISGQLNQVGLSSFVSLLATVYAKTQQKRVAVLTTGSVQDIVQLNEVKNTADITKNANAYRAIIHSTSVLDKDIWDYGYRLGAEEVFAFENTTQGLPVEDQIAVVDSVIGHIKSTMTLIEVVGDLNNPLNKHVLESAHLVLYVFNHSPKSMKLVKDFISTCDKSVVNRTGFVCVKFDRNVIAEKTLSEGIGINQKRVMQIPYNPAVIKGCVNGTLNTVATYMVKGHAEVANLRPKFLEVMQYLYDTQSKKYIKGINEWPKF